VLVLEQLAQAPEIPSRINADEHVLIEHVSRALRELCDQELVELLVPDDQEKHRLYGLTEQGERVWHRMQTTGIV
jgi:DNA-binding MarR family transcriptional regulator